jgi:hypothetical protein
MLLHAACAGKDRFGFAASAGQITGGEALPCAFDLRRADRTGSHQSPPASASG